MLSSVIEVRPGMQRTGATETAANVLRKVFPVVLLLCLAVSGCGTTCVSGFWNGSAGGITVINSSCPFTKATGAVAVQIGAASVDSSAFPPPLASPRPSLGASPSALPYDVQHIFVTLRGIEAHPDAVADEDSPAWQELAPGLSASPVQVDLLAPLAPLTPPAPLTTTGDSRSLDVPVRAIVPATVPADAYSQLRLRLLPRNPSPNDPIPESNACGDVGWNCVVFADHSTRPLEFASSEFAAVSMQPWGFGPAPEFHIPLEHDAARVFRVLPGEVIQLSIEFDAASSALFPSNVFSSNTAVRLVPVFKAVSR